MRLADGDSAAEGEAEAFVTRYEPLPTQMFSLEEQLHKFASEIMTLPRRHCILRIESEAPIRTRTADLSPAFKSEQFRALCLPRYLAKILASSSLAQRADIIDAEIAARFETLTAPPAGESDFTRPEPAPRRRPHLAVVTGTPSPEEAP